ncbi:hypothetical protein [Mesorhizobium sp.]|uniref:hypothetical protein n=1 Tax=Mesorhizobium sp. TaxID=1871066 RepID=UPI00257F4912|nr:hypothetical protein [Mesorhizobium sp.]
MNGSVILAATMAISELDSAETSADIAAARQHIDAAKELLREIVELSRDDGAENADRT